LTRGFNEEREAGVDRVSVDTYDRNLTWRDKRERSLEDKRAVQRDREISENRPKPEITPCFIMNRKDSCVSGSSGAQIPEDNAKTRSKFKKINGMDKFLERSYRGHQNKQEVKLMQHNMGNIAEN